MMVQAQRWSVAPEPIHPSIQGGKSIGLYYYLGADWFVDPPYADAGGAVFGDQPTVSVSEGYVTPWDKLDVFGSNLSDQSELVPGRIIGLDLYFWDFDGPEQAGAFILLGTGNIGNSSGFKDAELVPCHVGDCSRGQALSAVAPSSWGRIKASLR